MRISGETARGTRTEAGFARCPRLVFKDVVRTSCRLPTRSNTERTTSQCIDSTSFPDESAGERLKDDKGVTQPSTKTAAQPNCRGSCLSCSPLLFWHGVASAVRSRQLAALRVNFRPVSDPSKDLEVGTGRIHRLVQRTVSYDNFMHKRSTLWKRLLKNIEVACVARTRMIRQFFCGGD